MSDPVSALAHQSFDGFARIAEIGPLGMITLRCDLAAEVAGKKLAKSGFPMPDQRRIAHKDDRSAGWMSPDEFLLILPYEEVGAAIGTLQAAFNGDHFMAVDVSDARAVFRIEGPKAAQVLTKLCPVDFPNLAPNEIRRTRAAQVAAAFWAQDDGFTLVSFRSVAGYVMGLLRHSAQPGSELR